MEHLPTVDWTVAAQVGRSLIPPGPALPPKEAAEVVADLRQAAQFAPPLVAAASGLDAPAGSRVLVVDRRGWVTANAAMSEAMLAPLLTPPGDRGLGGRVSARAAGAQVGAVFAFVGTRILGQYDPFSDPARLLLVAPNMVAIERSLGVSAHDFRRWVCLHEETHRFQFGAAPWLPNHLRSLLAELVASEGTPFAGWGAGTKGPRIALLSPAQREAFDRVTAVMSVMEGHADVVMDLAAAGVLPSLPRLRQLFEQRRDRGGLVQLIGKLLGLGLKREQYREGAHFCRTVIERSGVATLNQVFEAPSLLPSLVELRDPQQWLHRMG